ncbi:hypothetical protein AB0395_46195 [Streptosporangium sp. NPDC051023]|uniref:hypothetical protein n=1 Tax=Streptosporangium sp. NPDC051023 TaxID=3155410 RepID=UPI00344F1FDB
MSITDHRPPTDAWTGLSIAAAALLLGAFVALVLGTGALLLLAAILAWRLS